MDQHEWSDNHPPPPIVVLKGEKHPNRHIIYFFKCTKRRTPSTLIVSGGRNKTSKETPLIGVDPARNPVIRTHYKRAPEGYSLFNDGRDLHIVDCLPLNLAYINYFL